MATNKHGCFIKVPAYYMLPDGGGHWMSSGQLVFRSYRYDLTITIEPGGLNNLASIPKFMPRWLIHANGPHRPACALHDPLCGVPGEYHIVQHNDSPHKVITRRMADIIFFDAMGCTRGSYYEALSTRARDLMDANSTSPWFTNDDNPLVGLPLRVFMYLGVRIGAAIKRIKGVCTGSRGRSEI